MNSKIRESMCRVVVSTALALAPLCLVTGCHSSSDGAAASFGVQATPAAGTFAGPTSQVSLTAVGQTLPNPVIHYTTDLSEPTAMSPVYAGPIAITDTTIVKAIAINTDMTQSDVMVKGYVQTDNPFAIAWAESGHGDITAEAFRHWDGDGDVQTSCALCHGDGGLKDYAIDGVVDVVGALPLGHGCNTCHAPVPLTIHDAPLNYPAVANVQFPSMASKTLEGPSNLCIACHQGRESGSSIDDDIIADPAGPYTFINIHYYAVGATLFGTETKGGYEYAGFSYAGRNAFGSHEVEQQSCVGCHMRGDLKDHRLEPLVADCTSCHSGTSFETLSGSPSANYAAIQTTSPQLLLAIQDYATNTLGFPIAYDAHSYPYFVFDTNSNGVADSNELGFGNRYDEFDASLLKASYNYQVSAKDPAGYIHNGVYVRQLLHDSIVDLGELPTVAAPGRAGFDSAAATKSEQWHISGHASSNAEPFRHWDGDGEVSSSCARCHTSSGFVDQIEDGVTSSAVGLGETVGCSACHNSTNLFADSSTRFDDLIAHGELEPVLFPSGATGTLGDASNICMTCHQGRSSGVALQSPDANSTVQAPTDYASFSFINRHYFAAGAIMFGSDATASYEYTGQTYAGRNMFAAHAGDNDTCVSCHMRGAQDHSFLPQLTDCNSCHLGIVEFEDLGLPDGIANVDYDGDASGESFDSEILGMAANLYTAIQNYADVTLPQSSKVIYVPGSYPYWFKDTDGNGVLTAGENSYGNRYQDFDIELLRAAYNYHSAQDPCGDIHNYKYVLQSLYDSTDMLDNGMLDGSIMGIRP